MKPIKAFVAIDFETANAKRVSACSLGVAKVVDGEIIEHRNYLIKPVGEYSPINIQIHGITPDKTSDAPTFDLVFTQIADDFVNLPILCYGSFDRSVFDALRDFYCLGCGHEIKFLDVCKYAHDCLPGLINYKLPTVSNALRLQNFHHHDSEADAVQCARVYLKLVSMDAGNQCQQPNFVHGSGLSIRDAFNQFAGNLLAKGIIDKDDAYELQLFLDSVAGKNKLLRSIADMAAIILEDGVVTEKESSLLCAMLEYGMENYSSHVGNKSPISPCRTATKRKLDLSMPDEYRPIFKNIPESYRERWEYVRQHPFQTFASSVVVITGNGDIIDRISAEQMVVAVGATLKNSTPTRNTDFCIVLGNNPEDCCSGKAERARALQEQGSPIRILNEQDFISMLKLSMEETA